MGKYMPKKSKIAVAGDGEVVFSSGVRTRAKTLALQRLNSSQNGSASNPDATSLCYLQLRSRRLEKPPLFSFKKRHRQCHVAAAAAAEGQFGNKGEIGGVNEKKEGCVEEGSCGENHLEFVAKDRSTRESTPCSLIRDPDKIGTPCSTTREKFSASSYRRVQSDELRHMPTSLEMEEFFIAAEEEQQRLFVDKYNFDIVNDLPLPGRYEWTKVIP